MEVLLLFSSVPYSCFLFWFGEFLVFGFWFVCLFRAELVTYVGSQARGQIRAGAAAAAADLCHSHTNARCKPQLRPTPQFAAMRDP